jgi:dCTP deaminase
VILSQPDLRAAVQRGEIVFDPPLEERQWGEASVDLRLGFSFTKFKDIRGISISVADGLKAVGELGLWANRKLKERDDFGKVERYILEPKEFVLAFTYESISIPNDLIGLVEGRSTYARVGLSMHQTAPWIQPGWKGPIVLEMMNHGPLRIELTPMVDRPCQLTFIKLSKPLPQDLLYGTKPGDAYQEQDHPLVHKAKK